MEQGCRQGQPEATGVGRMRAGGDGCDASGGTGVGAAEGRTVRGVRGEERGPGMPHFWLGQLGGG